MLLLLPFSSCLTTLQLLVTYENIVTDNRVTGLWKNNDDHIQVQKLMDSRFNDIFEKERASNKTVSKQDSLFYIKNYVITYGSGNLNYAWLGALVTFGDSKFINLYYQECYDRNGKVIHLNYQNSLDGSIIAKIEWKDPNIAQVRFLNGDYIKEVIISGKARIRHEYDPLFGTFIITASSNEMEKFLEKYGNDEHLYDKGVSYTLERKN